MNYFIYSIIYDFLAKITASKAREATWLAGNRAHNHAIVIVMHIIEWKNNMLLVLATIHLLLLFLVTV